MQKKSDIPTEFIRLGGVKANWFSSTEELSGNHEYLFSFPHEV